MKIFELKYRVSFITKDVFNSSKHVFAIFWYYCYIVFKTILFSITTKLIKKEEKIRICKYDIMFVNINQNVCFCLFLIDFQTFFFFFNWNFNIYNSYLILKSNLQLELLQVLFKKICKIPGSFIIIFIRKKNLLYYIYMCIW